MADTLLDIYGNYNRAMDEYNRLAEEYNKIYYAGDYGNLPERPEVPMKPRDPTDTQTLGEVLPQELYASLFGRGTPDVLTNEAWSLQNISSPFMSSAPETAYDTGNISAMNNPLFVASPDYLTSGQQGYSPNTVMASQNPYY